MAASGSLRILFVAVLLTAASCSDDKGTSASATTVASATTGASAATEEPTTCATAAGVEADDPFALARDIIDAAQVWNVDTICSLIGRVDIPDGLTRYRQAILDGLPVDIELVGKLLDPDTNTARYQFEVPAKGGDTRLELVWQHQSIGWVLVTAPFLAAD